jgi:peptidyl-prolyl cis-trans isomerase C
MIQSPGITVNGVKITPDQIGEEVQYHPAPTLPEARYKAMLALVVRELLLQQAAKMQLCKDAPEIPEDVIDRVLDRELSVPTPDVEACLRYYENNKSRFRTSPLFDVSHILYLAPPEEKDVREKARMRAERAIEIIKKMPGEFDVLARSESACSSAKDGGYLGQIGKGQTLPAFEAALMGMKGGEISQEPVPSEVGYHVILLHRRVEGQQLPFDAVSDWIAGFLKQQSWRRAFSQYVQILAGQAEISGFHLKIAETPLVQ